MNALWDPPLWIPTPRNLRFRAALRVLDELVEVLIADRRKGTGHADLLSRLMHLTDEETGQGMGDVELRDEMMTFLLAGHETTANAFTWTWVLLARNPSTRDAVAGEARRVLRGGRPTMEAIHQLDITRRVIYESLRLYPPAWVVERRAIEPDIVGGHAIPAGAWLVMSPWVTHRHPAFWDDAEAFDPDRFLPERSTGRHDFAYFPFGGGPRHCIGRNFALMELELILPMMADRFRIDLVPGHPIEPEAQITLRPRHGVMVTLDPIC